MVLNYFREITKIPRCSGNSEEMKQFLIKFAKSRGYKVKVDSCDNILATSEAPKVCFQAHYDMVCIGNYKNIEIIEENGFLKAKNSSLGADNGIGIALMMELMDRYKNLEFLFTSDEEIGLIGAFNLELSPKAKRLINLDSEDENIYIGCAGGFDVEVKINTKKRPYFGEVYQIKVENLPGGHSGVDIDKGHPNAIKEVAKKLKNSWTLLSIKGGEKANSIPRECEALVISNSKLKFPKIELKGKKILNSDELVRFLKAVPNGVLGIDRKFDIVNKSLNLAIVKNENIILSGRANSKELLDELKMEVRNFLSFVDCEFKIENEYPAWTPIKSNLAMEYQKVSNKNFKVIHAGLETAVLGKYFDEMISIGPNIYEPHSIRERVEIESVFKLQREIEEFLKKI